MQIKNFFFLFLLFAVLASCGNDDELIIEPPATSETFADGVFILNEGNFGSGNASVSYLDPETGDLSHNIFKDKNGFSLGDTATDIAFNEDLAFVVVNVSNTIEIVDRYTFESVATINTDLENPRKIAFLNGKAYVTNWADGSNPDDDFVAVFDAKTLDLVTKIAVEEGPENLLAEGDKVFVAHEGGWNFNNIISVILDDEVVKTIEVGEVPNSLAAGNGNLWVSSAGLPDYAGETAGMISKIELSILEVVQEYEFPENSNHPKNISFDNGKVYYTLVDGVYSFEASENILPTTADFILRDVAYLYGFAVRDGKIYATSANPDFTGNGNLIIYGTGTGDHIQSYQTGINPNGIFFND